jgi:hypothetical protein
VVASLLVRPFARLRLRFFPSLLEKGVAAKRIGADLVTPTANDRAIAGHRPSLSVGDQGRID